MNNNELVNNMMSCFHRVKRDMAKQFDIFVQKYNIKSSEGMLLLKIGLSSHSDKIIVTDIVNMLGLAPSTVSLTLNSLEEHGYIERSLNKDNRREIYVSLTIEGEKILKEIKKAHYNLMLELINYLGEENAKKLEELLERTATFLESRNNEKDKEEN